MKKIIDIDNEALANASGGCYCYCASRPYDYAKPTTLFGETPDEKSCRSFCKEINLTYADCKPIIPNIFSKDVRPDLEHPNNVLF